MEDSPIKEEESYAESYIENLQREINRIRYDLETFPLSEEGKQSLRAGMKRRETMIEGMRNALNRSIDRETLSTNGVPKIICQNCEKETISAIHFHICIHCKKDYRYEDGSN